MFADTATLELQAGRGGDGKLSFRHEKYRPNGGPDGGDGGRGGEIILLADHNQHTLSHYRTQRLIKAEPGQPGGGNRRAGKAGEPVIVKVPVGTVVTDEASGELLVDLLEAGQEAVIARGGRGGFGNAHFTSSTRQAPRLAEPGGVGDQLKVRLELKLVADIGLVGLPNAGKSTLLATISNARPEIADYPFTTTVPNLGVATQRGQDLLVADIPGLIEGASQGKGLGDEFLRHIERTAVILHLVAADSDNPAADYRIIRRELEEYSPELAGKPELVALSKSDATEPAVVEQAQRDLAELAGRCLVISAQAHKGITEAIDALLPIVAEARAKREEEVDELPVITTADLPDAWRIEEEDRAWRILGDRIEQFAGRTNTNQPDSLARLRDILRRTGVERELRRRGAEPDAIIRIGALEFPLEPGPDEFLDE